MLQQCNNSMHLSMGSYSIDGASMGIGIEGMLCLNCGATSCRIVKQYDEISPPPKGRDDVTHVPSKENPDFEIVQAVKAMGRLVSNGTIQHKVPFCPRSNTPLIYKASLRSPISAHLRVLVGRL